MVDGIDGPVGRAFGVGILAGLVFLALVNIAVLGIDTSTDGGAIDRNVVALALNAPAVNP